MQEAPRVKSPHPTSRQIIGARTIFSVRPTEAFLSPPLSPPPTSPLPPLPSSPPFTISNSSSPSGSFPRPKRPPRPQTSLPDLKPRTITSPEIARRQRTSEIAAQTKNSPTKPQNPPSRAARHSGPRSVLRLPSTLRLLTSTPQSTSTFTEDVLSALPLQPSRSPSKVHRSRSQASPEERSANHILLSWPFSQSSPTRGPKSKRFRKETKKPLARSALFIPKTPSEQSFGLHEARFDTLSLPRLRQASQSFNSAQESLLFTGTPQSSTGMIPASKNIASSISHKRSDAVSTLAFDFDQFRSPRTNVDAALQQDENITSLPELPQSAPYVKTPVIPPKSEKRCLPLYIRSDPKKDAPMKLDPFFSLPYSQTSRLAGPAPKTEHDFQRHQNQNSSSTSQSKPGDAAAPRIIVTSPSANVGTTVCGNEATVEVDVEQAGPTEEEIRRVKKKRILWIIGTISLVIIATGGILMGMIWKLNSLAGRG